MPDLAQQLLQNHLPDDHLAVFAHRLTEWLITDLNRSDEPVPDFTDSRAKALLRAANVIDDPTLHDFVKRMEGGETPALSNAEGAVRLALYDLLTETKLATDNEVQALAAVSGSTPEIENITIVWFALSIVAHAWKSGYPLHQLDPASPPGEYSPAGQIVKRAATFMRQQITRSATERDKLVRKLAYTGGAAPGTPSLDNMAQEPPAAPVPPHYRSPIPVRYPEVARDTLHVEPDEEPVLPTPTISTAAPLKITLDDLPDEEQQPIRMPAIRITEDQVRRPTSPQPPPRQSTPPRTAWNRGSQPLRSTKLRVIVQEHPGGSGMYGLQVKVTGRGVKSQVAGTTNPDGQFLCELPVRAQSGLTYDIDITWPRDLGGHTERKSITLNADRTQFELPFYLRHNP